MSVLVSDTARCFTVVMYCVSETAVFGKQCFCSCLQIKRLNFLPKATQLLSVEAEFEICLLTPEPTLFTSTVYSFSGSHDK